MAIAILVGRNEAEQQATQWFIDALRDALLSLDRKLDIRIWPHIGNPDDIDALLVWRHPVGALQSFSKVKIIISLAAGVDHVLMDPHISTHVPLVRVIDPYMANDIAQYVIAYVLNYIKRVPHWAEKQREKKWAKEPPFSFANQAVGVMGLGFLGGRVAHLLTQLGLPVLGWSRSPKNLSGITHFVGEKQFYDFLAQTHILICMLPLTKHTKNLLNQNTFAHLPQGSYLINVGRGEQLVEEDLLAALDNGQLSGACLDVFRKEPLAADHPFWSHPRIIVTPHIASVTNVNTVAPQVLKNYQLALAGKPLLNQVDYLKGY